MATGLQLFALTADGPRALKADSSGASVHDLLEELPDGVYSALRTFHHDRFLRLDAHCDRTDRSMAGLGWNRKLDRETLSSALDATVRAYPLPDARVRFDVLREPFELQGIRSDVFLALSPFVPVSAEFVRDGVGVDVARHLRRETPRIKTTGFVRARKPLPLGTQQQFESLLLDADDRILECTSANIGFVRDGAIVAADDGVLEGITSLILRGLAPQIGLAWEHERLPLRDLGRVQEAFLTSSSRGIVPVVRAAGVTIGDGRVGPRVRSLIEAYAAFAERAARPAID